MFRLALTTLATAGMVACSSAPYRDASEASLYITRGMTYDEALKIASYYPIQRTFKDRGTALQFCSGFGGNESSPGGEYVVVWFVDDRVEGLTQYRAAAGLAGCEYAMREVDWGQAPADVKIKLNID